MKKSMGFSICMWVLTGALAQAGEQPVYDSETETLTIPSVILQGQPGYFQDGLLQPAGEGSWRITQLHEGVLLEEKYVEEIWTTSTTGLPHQFFIHVAGTFESACPEVGRVEQQWQDNVLQVYVYYKNTKWARNPESVVCAAVGVPFELTIPLAIYGLQAGEYDVRINNLAFKKIKLEQDNVGRDEFGDERRSHCQYEPAQQGGSMAYACSNESELTLQ